MDDGKDMRGPHRDSDADAGIRDAALPDETLSGVAGGAIGSYGDEPVCPRCGNNTAVSLMWRISGTDCWECSRCSITWQTDNKM